MKNQSQSALVPGINQGTLALLLGVSRSLISHWQHGRRSLPLRSMLLLNQIRDAIIHANQQSKPAAMPHPESARRLADWEEVKKRETVIYRYKLHGLEQALEEMQSTHRKMQEQHAMIDGLISTTLESEYGSRIYIYWAIAKENCLQSLLRTDAVEQAKLEEKIRWYRMMLGEI